MCYKIIVVVMYIIYVSGSGIYHENTKITFSPESNAEFFGFSVVLSRFGLIVGAPKARVNNKQSGAAYNCSLDDLDLTDGAHTKAVSCNPISLSGSRFSRMNSFYKDDMWLGATIASLSDGKTLYCAPRFTEPFGAKHLLAHGECVVQRGYSSGSSSSLVHPLTDDRGRMHEAFMTDGKRREYGEYGTHLNFYAYGQAGMSVKVIEQLKGNNRVIIGAPGLLQWTGGIIHFLYSTRETSSSLYRQVISNPYFTPELGPDDYFGYSVEGGVFRDDDDILFVGGAPRSMRGYGQVLVFEPTLVERYPLKIYAKLRGPQLGAYFGASLCCLDIDGDGLSDLLVGAPNYVKKDGGLPYDQGAVFVYMTRHFGNNFNLTETGLVMGSGASGARFGTTIANLGDVDGDGFRDVAIGAPWENDGSGAVYIYRGSANGLKSQYAQKIEAKGALSFGISISKGIDVDHNNCNDLAIGAAVSNSSYLFRCVPTISVKPSIKVPDAMNLPHNATGFTALFCIDASARPQWPFVKAGFKARIVIDPEEGRARISESEDSQYNVTLTPGNTKCDERTVDVKPTADLSKPISIKFYLEPEELLKNDSTMFNYHAARVSEDSVLVSSFLIQLVRDCGEDMICTPWLEMTLEALDDPYTPGSSDKLGARLTILNTEEPAYGAKVNITLPMIPKRLPSPCSLEDLVMTCDIPAPLFRDQEVSWDIELEYKESNSSYLKMVAQLDDPLYYRNISEENVVDVDITILPVSVFNIIGKSLPNDTILVERDKLNDEDGVIFSHYYEITNFGPSSWLNTEISITLPSVVILSNSIKNCVQRENETSLDCAWSIPAKVSRSVILPLRFDSVRYAELLKQNTTVNITTEIVITNAQDGNRTATVTTSLILEPAPPIWPLILGAVAGVFLLAAIVYLMYRFGFFSRHQRERLKELKDGQTVPLTESDAGCSTGPPSITDETQQELLFDSD